MNNKRKLEILNENTELNNALINNGWLKKKSP